jgi:hypothetical protein
MTARSFDLIRRMKEGVGLLKRRGNEQRLQRGLR